MVSASYDRYFYGACVPMPGRQTNDFGSCTGMGPFSSSSSAAGQLLYLVNEKGVLQVVDPAKPEGEVVGELDLGETIIGTPSISADAIYIRSDGHLWKISKSSVKVS